MSAWGRIDFKAFYIRRGLRLGPPMVITLLRLRCLSPHRGRPGREIRLARDPLFGTVSVEFRADLWRPASRHAHPDLVAIGRGAVLFDVALGHVVAAAALARRNHKDHFRRDRRDLDSSRGAALGGVEILFLATFRLGQPPDLRARRRSALRRACRNAGELGPAAGSRNAYAMPIKGARLDMRG